MVLLSIDHEDPRRFGDLAGFFAAAAATGGRALGSTPRLS
jgi:hypothetical protein